VTCIGCLAAFGALVVIVAGFVAWGISLDPNRPRLRNLPDEWRWALQGAGIAVLAVVLYVALTLALD
jgi:hypothetical protein